MRAEAPPASTIFQAWRAARYVVRHASCYAERMVDYIRIAVEPTAFTGHQGEHVRHGGLRVESSRWARTELWAGWHGLLDRLGELPAVLRIGEAS